jgi:pyruvate formate lyase activating enzyme
MNGLPAVKGFIETGFVDWAGKVASVVFLPRCNFSCPYCHNHRLVSDPESYRTFDLDEVLERMEALRGWLDGVTVTGGEPTIHKELPSFLKVFKERRWKVKLDTNGSNPAMLGELIDGGLISAVSLDVKAPLEEIPYRRNAGRGADPCAVRRSLELLARSEVPAELRTTVHTGLLSVAEMARIITQTSEIFGCYKAIKWQACQVSDTLDPSLPKNGASDRETLSRLVLEAEELAKTSGHLTEGGPTS